MGANAKVVEQAYAAFGTGDIPGLVALVADDVTWTSPRTLPQGGDYKGPAGVGQFFEKVGAAWDGLSAQVECLGEIGSEVVVAVVRLDGKLGGKPAGYGSSHVFTVRNGKIAGWREFTDLDAPLG